MKILLVADTEEKLLWDDWGEQTRDMLSGAELILSAGDLDAAYLEFLVTMLNVPLVYVKGNHDGAYDEKAPEGCISAEGRIVEAAGLRILGLGGSMRYKDNAEDMYTEEEMQRRIASLRGRFLRDRISGKSGLDILLTHAPAKGYGDMEDIAHTGFECFNVLLERFRPLLHCYGHVHREYGNFRRKIIHPSGAELINGSGYYLIDIE